MLSHKVLTRSDLDAAGRYYADAEDDYYTKDLDASAWQGKGAERLGLQGPVERVRFQQLLSGQVKPGIEITRSAKRGDAKERIGIDLTFSAPKSVSIQALVGGDVRLIKAHEEAVAATLDHAETLAQARVKQGGKSAVVDTGNLIIGKFRHETSREQDPQLHTHAVVMNLTRRDDGQWRALRNDKIIKSASYLGAHYRAELASRLTELGYELRHGKDGTFELAHISRDQLKAFSGRSAAIEAALDDAGLDRATATTAEKQAATMQTRPKKVQAERAALYRSWQATAKEAGIQFHVPAREAEKPGHGHPEAEQREHGERERMAPEPGERPAPPAGEPGRAPTSVPEIHDTDASAAESAGTAPESPAAAVRNAARAVAADKAVRYAVNHLTERQAIVTESRLLDVATKHGMGAVTVPTVREAIDRLAKKGTLIREAPLYQAADDVRSNDKRTREGWVKLLASRGMPMTDAVKQVDVGIESGRLLIAESRYTTTAALGRERSILNMERDGRASVTPIMNKTDADAALASTRLNAKQREAAAEIVGTTNQIIGVQGLAGTGKTAMLAETRTLAEQAGFRVLAAAPYGAQVKELQANGFEAKTVMALVRAAEKGLDDKTLLVIDEAGVMPSRLMDRTLRMAKDAGARVVLLGDTGQTKAIEAGKPFDQLQRAGMETVQLDEIIRQRDPEMRAAVADAAVGRSVEALARIKNVVEVPDAPARWQRIVNDFMELPTETREKTLIISGTNDARRAMNAMIREREERVGNGITYDTLIRRDTTQEERRYSKSYQVGDVIQPERDYPRYGLQRGETYHVIETGPGNKLTVTDATGKQVEFSPAVANRLSVYEPERKELAAGDRVRITRNDATLDVANGDRFSVKEVTPTEVVLVDDKREVRLPADKPLHLDYAHATTVHSAQGLTSERALYDADSRSPTTSREVFYVAISRVRDQASIYTDNVAALPRSVARSTIKHAAMELVRAKPPQLQTPQILAEAEKRHPSLEHEAQA